MTVIRGDSKYPKENMNNQKENLLKQKLLVKLYHPVISIFPAEVTKYEGKVQRAKETYEISNDKTKREIESSRRAHDTLIDTQLLTVLVCQVSQHPQLDFWLISLGQIICDSCTKFRGGHCHASTTEGSFSANVFE
jgi:hypothetical protein